MPHVHGSRSIFGVALTQHSLRCSLSPSSNPPPPRPLHGVVVYSLVVLIGGYPDEATTAGRHRWRVAKRAGRRGALQGLEIRVMMFPRVHPRCWQTFWRVLGAADLLVTYFKTEDAVNEMLSTPAPEFVT